MTRKEAIAQGQRLAGIGYRDVRLASWSDGSHSVDAIGSLGFRQRFDNLAQVDDAVESYTVPLEY